MPEVIRVFLCNFFASFSGKNSLFHFSAIVLTYIIVVSGFDWFYFTKIQTPFLRSILFPAVAIGGLLPILLPIALYVAGVTFRDRVTTITSFALLQAVLLGSLISSIYKAFTGRIQPSFSNVTIDSSNQFQFGFFEHGIFWGWPSSHTTIAFAMVCTLICLYPMKKSVRYIALLYAFYIGLGVTIGIHWFSEFVAGALIGSAIGIAVGKTFVSRLSQSIF